MFIVIILHFVGNVSAELVKQGGINTGNEVGPDRLL